MGSSPSTNVNHGIIGIEKIQELNNLVLPNCDVDPSHKMMQLNMVCIDERCEFTHQLNPLCAQCLEDKQFHDYSGHKCISVPSLLKEIGNQAFENEKMNQQQKKNLNRQVFRGSNQGRSTLAYNTLGDHLVQNLEGILKNLECIKASCRNLESNVRQTLRTYSDTKNQIILNSNWNVICKLYESISQQPVSSQELRNSLAELQHYCKLDNQQVLLFDLEKTIQDYLEQDTLDYAKQMIKICQSIDEMTKVALELSKPCDFDKYKQEVLNELKSIKEEKDIQFQIELEQSNILKDTMHSQFKQTKITQDTLRTSQQKWSPQKEQINASKFEQNEILRASQPKLKKIPDLIAQERQGLFKFKTITKYINIILYKNQKLQNLNQFRIEMQKYNYWQIKQQNIFIKQNLVVEMEEHVKIVNIILFKT